MKKLLLPIDGLNPARTHAAVSKAVSLHGQQPVQIHVLSVQPPVSGHVAMFFDARELLGIQHGAGQEELAPVLAQLQTAGVACTSSVRVGRRAETIAAAARELGCELIVMGPDGDDGFLGALFGSVAEQVRRLLGGAGNYQVIGA